MWQTLEPSKKAAYVAKAEKLKAEYLASPEGIAAESAKESADDEGADDEGAEPSKDGRARKKQKRAKRPRFSGFLLFCKDARPKLQAKAKKDPSKALAIPDQAREMGRQWNKLSDAKKAPYVADFFSDDSLCSPM